MDKPANSVLNEYLPYFESRDASDSIERAVVAMYSRGNTSLSKGLYLTETQYEKQLEFVSKCDLTPIGQAS